MLVAAARFEFLPVNVLLLAPQPFYRERGTPIAVRLLAEELCSAGHAVDLLVYHAGEDISFPGLRLLRAAAPPLKIRPCRPSLEV